ncbi:MAG: homocysteine S-methyltransferase family protein [Planctomycetota bacterium]|jgi:S-methylmethionine-dependent homocysteine/selenocysteine methylase
MSKYRDNLPQLSQELFITDGGLETTLMFNNGFELPEFAAFDLLKHTGGYEVLRNYYLTYVNLAKANEVGFILESPTWRASRDWGQKLGYSTGDLREMNRKSIALLQDIRYQLENGKNNMVISGCLGPRGDGYNIAAKMTAEEAKNYHLEQIGTLSETEADLVSAFTINYAEEAVGISQAAQSVGTPVVISFTVETDGRLPSGQPLGEAIQTVDQATGNGPAYYMINCAHPTHFMDALTIDEPWLRRIRAVRANASTKSHAELDEAVELDDGDPVDLGVRYAELKDRLPHLNIFGGCCGTDHRHVEEICKAVKQYN